MMAAKRRIGRGVALGSAVGLLMAATQVRGGEAEVVAPRRARPIDGLADSARDGDPLEDLSVLERVSFVMLGGRVVRAD